VPVFADVRRNVESSPPGGTIGWLINKDAVLVVDTQYADTAKMCVDGLKPKTANRQMTSSSIRTTTRIIRGNAIFRAEAKKLIAQARVPELQRMVAAATPNALRRSWRTRSTRPGRRSSATRPSARSNGPGHTGGDGIIHFERAHVVHMGDLLFHERHPRVDRPAGASIQNWITILEKVSKDMPDDTIYIAGHSKEGLPVTVDRKAVLRFRDYFDAVLSMTRKAIAQGQTKEAIAATAALPGFESYQSARRSSRSPVCWAPLTTSLPRSQGLFSFGSSALMSVQSSRRHSRSQSGHHVR
jgi:hypothetical protein